MTKIQKDNKNVAKFPNLRFPEFTEEWNREKIASILTIGSGKDYKHLSKGTIPVFGTGGYMASVDDFLYEGESVCIGRKGTINKPLYFNGKFWTVDTLFYTHSFKNVLPKFVYNIFEQINWLKYNEASGVPSLSKSTIEQIDINIPCVEEQQKIATFLSLIDERIQAQNKIIEQLETLIKGLCQKLILNQVPNKKINNCVSSYSSSLTESDVIDKNGIYPVYGATGIIAFTENPQINEDAILIIKDGSGVGKVQYASDKFSVIGTLNYLTVKPDVNLKYIFFCLKYFNFEKYKVGSGIPHIYFKDYGETFIYCPPLEEQNKIESLLSSIDSKINIETQYIKELKEQKTFLFQQMFV
ncbi:restriction endonuclease subunit S [Elizabethkingia anophelis]|nr:restriction endonuclease subunit S [Elizabethkingia anophelis]